jgi:hypothetical protein
MGLGLNVAGQSTRIEPAGQWIAALSEEEQQEYLDTYPELEANWHPEYGDRSSRLVLIGTGMDHDAVRGRLTDALLTEAEMDADWTAFDDLFPVFTTDDEEAEAADDESAEEVGLAD